MIVLKVQLPVGRLSSGALIESGFDDALNKCVTFHAYSDLMKARILEKIAAGGPYTVTITDETPRDGEWLEYPIKSQEESCSVLSDDVHRGRRYS